MLTHLTLHFTGPICRCETRETHWWLSDENGKLKLSVECKLCGTKYVAPCDKLRAGYTFEIPYPAGMKKVAVAKTAGPSADGNVVPFPGK